MRLKLAASHRSRYFALVSLLSLPCLLSSHTTTVSAEPPSELHRLHERLEHLNRQQEELEEVIPDLERELEKLHEKVEQTEREREETVAQIERIERGHRGKVQEEDPRGEMRELFELVRDLRSEVRELRNEVRELRNEKEGDEQPERAEIIDNAKRNARARQEAIEERERDLKEEQRENREKD